MPRAKHHTAWAGALAVAAELSRRGYDAAITLGNTPALDIICSSPGEKAFTVQVKSASSPNWVLIRKKYLEGTPRRDLYFAVVLVPPDDAKPFVFHILTHAEVCKSYSRQSKQREAGQPFKGGMEGLAWGDIKESRDRVEARTTTERVDARLKASRSFKEKTREPFRHSRVRSLG